MAKDKEKKKKNTCRRLKQGDKYICPHCRDGVALQ